MTKEQHTQWFPANVTPSRDGVYQVRIRNGVRYARWEGGQWHLALQKFDKAKTSCMKSHDCYSHKFGGWRGLAQDPSQ